MKNILLITALIFAGFTANAQFTLIPDTNFEKALIGLGYDSGPLDNRVPTANINTITFLDVSDTNIVDLTGIEDFVALDTLYCQKNNIDTLDLSDNLNLTSLLCWGNQLTNLNVSRNTRLMALSCGRNLLETLDVSNNTVLNELFCFKNQLTTLDLSKDTLLRTLQCNDNQLICLNLKNGKKNSLTNFNAIVNPNLTCIEVDDSTYSADNWTGIDGGVMFSTDCNNSCSSFGVSITEQTLKNLSVYPNPSSGAITIDLGEIQEQLSATLYNNLGQVVFTQFFVNTTKIDLSIEAPSGIYFLQLTTPTTTKTIKVLKE